VIDFVGKDGEVMKRYGWVNGGKLGFQLLKDIRAL